MRRFLVLAAVMAIGSLVDQPHSANIHSGLGHAPDADEAELIVKQAAFLRGSEFRAENGVAVAPERVIIYYQGITDPARAVPHPQGLKYVVGNAAATSPDQNPSARWSCVGFPESSRDFMSCPPGSKLETYLDFPTCWDGSRSDSPNHKDHLTWGIGGVGGTCPASHPVVLPGWSF